MTINCTIGTISNDNVTITEEKTQTEQLDTCFWFIGGLFLLVEYPDARTLQTNNCSAITRYKHLTVVSILVNRELKNNMCYVVTAVLVPHLDTGCCWKGNCVMVHTGSSSAPRRRHQSLEILGQSVEFQYCRANKYQNLQLVRQNDNVLDLAFDI